MIHVMDGVRPSGVAPRPLVLAKPQVRPAAPVRAAMRPAEVRRYVVGMDGIRRPVPPAPRDVIAAMNAPMAAPAAVASEAVRPAATPVWSLPSLRLPHIGWRRPAIAFGLVATAFVASSAVVHSLATPQTTTARAAAASEQTEQKAAPAPKEAPAAVVATPAPTPQNTGLQQILDNFVAANPTKFGIVVKNLTTGETAAINPDQQIMSASLYKLFVAQRILQRIDLGQLDYGTAAGGGSGRNIDQCLTVMINISDNTCGRALGSILNWGSQDQALAMEGYKQTTLATPQKTSAGDVATLLGRLYSGTLVSGNAGNKFMGLLKDQRVNNRLPQGLPAGTVIAHKTGDLDGVVHDAGIVYGPKANYLVVVMSGPWASPGNAPAMFADLSTQLWNHFEQ